ncbi:MAG: hypothetical protein SGJ03_03565 [Alphaproteobacteria bacterium]|nr:hypothetical protein [Alphaproteobacteria bacterium]
MDRGGGVSGGRTGATDWVISSGMSFCARIAAGAILSDDVIVVFTQTQSPSQKCVVSSEEQSLHGVSQSGWLSALAMLMPVPVDRQAAKAADTGATASVAISVKLTILFTMVDRCHIAFEAYYIILALE